MAAEKKDMPEGLTRLPEEYQTTNEGIERLISLIAKTDADSKKQVTALAKEYRKEILKIVSDQDKVQKEVAHYIVELKKAGATDKEISAYLQKNGKLKTGEEELSRAMKDMQDKLSSMADSTKFKTEEDRKLAERQAKTLEKYFKDKEKPKSQSWVGEKAKAAKEETGGALKDSLAKGLGVGFQTMLGPLRLIVDPILKLGGTDSLSLFDKIIEKSRDSEAARNEDMIDRFSDLNDLYSEEEERKKEERKNGKKKSVSKREDNVDELLGDVRETLSDNKKQKTVKKKPKKSKAADDELFPAPMPETKREDNVDELLGDNAGTLVDLVTEIRNMLSDSETEHTDLAKPDDTPPIKMPLEKSEKSFDDLLDENKTPGIFDDGKETESLEGLMDYIQPTRSALLKQGGVIGAAAIFLADLLTSGEGKGLEAEGEEGGGFNFFGGIPGGVKGFVTKMLPALKVAVPFAVAAAGAAMVAGGLHLQKRDTADAKKYADKGRYGKATETFLLGDSERVTEENANSELGRAVGKNTLMVGGAGLAVAGGAGIAAMGSTVAAGGGIAAMGGLGAAAGAAGTAGLAAVGAVVPPVLIAAAIVAAATAVAKGTQEAYKLEYDKNAASIQKELNRVLLDEEAPFLKRVGAGFKSDWRALTSTLAGGIRGITNVVDVETERQFQNQLDTLRKEADEGNAESARLYEIMSQQSFREMTEKEKERLLRSEGLYGAYVEVVDKCETSFWEKLKIAAKAGLKGIQNAANTVNESMKGRMTAEWENETLKGMDDTLRKDPERVERLKNSDAYQKALEDGGDPLKAMQEAFLDEERQMAMASGDLDTNGMVVSLFDKVKLGFKSFTDISDEAIRQSTEFDTRRLQLLAEGKSAEEADQQAMEEQRELLNNQMNLRLKQTKEYKEAFKKALEEGKDLKTAEREALAKTKQNTRNLRSFGETLSEGLRGLWDGARGLGTRIWDWVSGRGGSSTPAPAAPDTEIHDGIVYKDGKVIAVDDDDHIIATKNEPFIGDKEVRQADAVPVTPVVENKFSDVNIVDVLTKILNALDNKNFSPTINNVSEDSGMSFDGLRMAGVL